MPPRKPPAPLWVNALLLSTIALALVCAVATALVRGVG